MRKFENIKIHNFKYNSRELLFKYLRKQCGYKFMVLYLLVMEDGGLLIGYRVKYKKVTI